MALESVLKETGKGLLAGLATALDPVGTAISSVDYFYTGVGPSNRERAVNTFRSEVYQVVYEKDKDMNFKKDYVPRAVGTATGVVAGISGIVALSYFINPLAALTMPVVFGAYSLVQGIKKYAHDFVNGEKIKGRYEKSGFFSGFRFGYHQMTEFPVVSSWYELESDLTGRGIENSRIKSAIKDSSNVRRNFSSVLGVFAGRFFGAVISIASLGIVPLYKTVRDVGKNFEKKKEKKKV